jgi:hypothetical protein
VANGIHTRCRNDYGQFGKLDSVGYVGQEGTDQVTRERCQREEYDSREEAVPSSSYLLEACP